MCRLINLLNFWVVAQYELNPELIKHRHCLSCGVSAAERFEVGLQKDELQFRSFGIVTAPRYVSVSKITKSLVRYAF